MSTATKEKAPARASNTEPGKNQEHPQDTTEAADDKPLCLPALGLYANATATKQCADLTLEELIEAIQGDEFKEQITKLRATLAAGDDDGYSIAKKDLMAVSVSGTCEGPRAKAIQEGRFTHSGYLQLDFDAADNIGWEVGEIVEMLQAEPRIVAAFVSPSGHGVKGIARIPVCTSKEEHVACFVAARDAWRARNLVIDEACKDPVRLMFISHDPNAWIDLSRTAMFEPVPPQTDRRQQELPQPPTAVSKAPRQGLIVRETGGHREITAEDVRAMLAAIPPRPEYSQWLRIASAVWDATDEATGTALLNSWSPEESPGEYAEKFSHRLTEVHAGTLVMIAKENGWQPEPRQQTIIKTNKDAISDGKATSQDDCRAILAERAFNAATVPQRPIPILLLGDKVISTPGNLTNIQAPAKAGKSAVIGAIIAAMFNGNRQGADTLGFSADNSEGRAVLHFDTEQSRFDHDGLIRRAMTRARVDTPPPWFRSYCLTDLSTGQRQHVISYAVEDAAIAHGGIFGIIIDGVADICRDPNNPEEAFGLVDGLHAGAIKHDCAIITVLHENPGSETGKMRGHLGSQLERKAETPLRLAKDPGSGITTIWTDRARHCHIPKDKGTCFSWSDTQGMHVSRGSAGEIKASEKRQKFIEEAEAAFGDSESLSYSALVAAIMQATGLKSEKTAEKRITTYAAEGIISKTPGGSYTLKS
jgi:hypothetical protein